MILVELDEGDRQLILLALAELSISRPGFDAALNSVAIQFDQVEKGRAVMYDKFRGFKPIIDSAQQLEGFC